MLGRARFRVPAGERRDVAVRLTRRGLAHVRTALRRQHEALLDLGPRVRGGRLGAGAGVSAVLITRIRPPRS